MARDSMLDATLEPPSTSVPGRASAAVLTHEHRLLEQLLQRHQRALVDARIEQAAAHWQRYRQALAAHIDQEEAGLDQLDSDALRWPLRLYRAEHRRILELADRIADQLARAPRRATAVFRIDMLEREKTLKGVLEHHHEREEQDLYLVWDRAIDNGR